MNMNINVTLTASPQLAELVNNLISAFKPQLQTSTVIKGQNETMAIQVAPVVKIEESSTLATTSQEPTGAIVEKITIEELRAAVAVKAKAGKKDNIKALLAEFEAESVSTLDAKNYADFKTKLEKI